MGIRIILKNFLNLIRIKHWIKNIVILIPLVFSLNFYNEILLIKTIIVTVAFCLISSSVYIINDIFDKEKDKFHSVKKFRPIAAGIISIKTAVFITIVFLLSSIYLIYITNKTCLIFLCLYFTMNIIYSKFLKNIELIDVFIIAFGFLIRVLTGCIVINVLPSKFLILLTILISCFFGFSKRYIEIKTQNINTRKVNIKYNTDVLSQLMSISASSAIVFYVMYSIDGTINIYLNTDLFYITSIPFIFIILRLLLLVNKEYQDEDICNLLYNDKQIIISILIYILMIIILLKN